MKAIALVGVYPAFCRNTRRKDGSGVALRHE
jgi:hypothetical protein